MTIPRIRDLADPSFDPFLIDQMMFGDYRDPYERIDAARADGPVVRTSYRSILGLGEDGVDPAKPRYTVLSYAAVAEALDKPDIFSNRSFDPTLGAVYGPILTVMDPPRHTINRRILQRAFRPDVVRGWGRDYVAPIVAELIDGLRGAERADLVARYTRPFPFRVITRMLDLPREDEETFYRLTIAQLSLFLEMGPAHEAAAKLGDYFTALIADRRAATS